MLCTFICCQKIKHQCLYWLYCINSIYRVYDSFFPSGKQPGNPSHSGSPCAALVAMSNWSMPGWLFLWRMSLLSKEMFGQLVCHLLVGFPDALIALPSSGKQEWYWAMWNTFLPFVTFFFPKKDKDYWEKWNGKWTSLPFVGTPFQANLNSKWHFYPQYEF